MAVTLRYFAAAKAVLGRGGETREAAGIRIGELLRTLASETADPPAASAVLERCSFLLNAEATTDLRAVLADGDTLDVLPPFAGG
ncbi:MoaD/ThiS family protein [Herbiconiux sp.]|uniref:MoaD/ThiS family protein n=1 Tax=Herbiconiux sp. TaxID=1871186 RepID=UPI0025C33D6A|nr:MoaD/ThiS family protein [Herbiconiux sp.]